jgi:hypothetical protein
VHTQLRVHAKMRAPRALALVVALCSVVRSLGAASTVLPLDGLSWGIANRNGSINLRSKLVRALDRCIESKYSLLASLGDLRSEPPGSRRPSRPPPVA